MLLRMPAHVYPLHKSPKGRDSLFTWHRAETPCTNTVSSQSLTAFGAGVSAGLCCRQLCCLDMHCWYSLLGQAKMVSASNGTRKKVAGLEEG